MSDGLRMIEFVRDTGAAPPAVYHEQMTSNRLATIVVGAVFTALGAVVIVLRSWIISQRMRNFGKDDTFMFIAWLCSLGFAAASYVSVRWGVGLLTNDAPPEWATSAIKAVYAIEIFYYLSLYFIKMSLLFLYLRLSSSQKTTRFWKSTVVTMVLVTLHFLSTVVVFSIQCVPMEKYWNPTVPGFCISITAFFYSTNIFTIITDVVILALPISTLWQVQRPRKQRLAIVGAFLVGGVSTVASCIRLYSVRIYTESHEPMRDAAPINTWSFVEINLGIVCASAPALKALISSQHRTITKFTNKYMSDRSQASGRSGRTKGSKGSKGSKGATTVEIFSLSNLTTKGGRDDGESEKALRYNDDLESGQVVTHVSPRESDDEITRNGSRSTMGQGRGTSPPRTPHESLMRNLPNSTGGQSEQPPASPIAKPVSAKLTKTPYRNTSLARMRSPTPGPGHDDVIEEPIPSSPYGASLPTDEIVKEVSYSVTRSG